MNEPIVIVGGGLAGLTLGIGLKQRGVPVTVWEAGRYPRHRVCGEFISGQGQRSLERLGLLKRLPTEKICEARSAAFHLGERSTQTRALPEPALCVSRFVLDEFLAGEFERLGGELRVGQRWTGDWETGVVRASGRRAAPVVEGWRLFGLKIHARGVRMEADLEMHIVPDGYVGICGLADGEVNICGLFRSRATVPDLARKWRDWLGGPEGSTLRARLAGAEFEEASLSSVAGISLRPRRAVGAEECAVGDAVTMIPPVTGNGMSMAFESAELAIEPLAKFHRGEASWEEAGASIAAACDARFRTRLRWAGLVQRVLFQQAGREAMFRLAQNSEWLWRWLFARTR